MHEQRLAEKLKEIAASPLSQRMSRAVQEQIDHATDRSFPSILILLTEISLWADEASALEARLREAQAAEREACAKIAEDYAAEIEQWKDTGLCHEIAAKIRARGKEEKAGDL